MTTDIKRSRAHIGGPFPHDRRLANLAIDCRAATNNGETVIQFLMRVLGDEAEATTNRLTAATILLDRGWGKAPQHIEINHTSDALTEVRAWPLEKLRLLVRNLEAIEAQSEVIDTPTPPGSISEGDRR